MSRIIHRNGETRCGFCGGSGYFRGSYGDITCPDCGGEGSWTDEPVRERPAYTPSPEYLAWCEQVDGDPVPKRMRAA